MKKIYFLIKKLIRKEFLDKSEKEKALKIINVFFALFIFYCKYKNITSIYVFISIYCISECFKFEIEDIFNEFKYKRIFYGFIFYLLFPLLSLIFNNFYWSLFSVLYCSKCIKLLQDKKII